MKIVVFTNGTFQLIYQLAYLYQNNMLNQPIMVIRYGRSTSHMLECEKLLCDMNGLIFAGSLKTIQPKIDMLLKKNGLLYFLYKFRLEKILRKMAKKITNPYSPTQIEDVVTVFRPHLEDVLLVALFPQAKLHFIADGLLSGFSNNIEIPNLWKKKGIKNPYRKDSKNLIWAAKGLEKNLNKFGIIKPIEEKFIEQIKDKISIEPGFLEWKKSVTSPCLSRKASCLLLQPFSLFNWMDIQEELAFYKKIINYEVTTLNNFVFVKPHPRDSDEKLTLLKKSIPQNILEHVLFIQPNKYSVLPLELLSKYLNIQTVIGLTSTALITMANITNIDVKFYSGSCLPSRLQDEIKIIANINMNELIFL